ncbi:MAG: sugar transferase [Planctomycetota bacterium]
MNTATEAYAAPRQSLRPETALDRVSNDSPSHNLHDTSTDQPTEHPPEAAVGSSSRADRETIVSANGTDLPALHASPVSDANDWPTVWGLSPLDLHEHFWASRQLQVVRAADPTQNIGSGLFLLTPPGTLLLFRFRRLIGFLGRRQPRLIAFQLRNERRHGCRELTETGEGLQLTRFRRIYDRPDENVSRVFVTPDAEIARAWAETLSDEEREERILQLADVADPSMASVPGLVYKSADRNDVMEFVRELVRFWSKPNSSIERARNVRDQVWADVDTDVSTEARLEGSIWIGAGRTLDASAGIVGPTVLWDNPDTRPAAPERPATLEAEDDGDDEHDFSQAPSRPVGPVGKRLFDILFSLVMLSITLPLYPFIALLIWIDDRRPFFFAHKRQTFGGREFPCYKFRSMRNDAEEIKRRLMEENQSDGPQFFMKRDPRLLRIGSLIRSTKIDEFPQFFNVLLGHMSIVGPRPSPYDENQYYPSWREARLTARPGITGLWQVMRTREEGLDFQEWIRYDIEYVEKASWKLDLWILWRTAVIMVRDAVEMIRKDNPDDDKKEDEKSAGESKD